MMQIIYEGYVTYLQEWSGFTNFTAIISKLKINEPFLCVLQGKSRNTLPALSFNTSLSTYFIDKSEKVI